MMIHFNLLRKAVRTTMDPNGDPDTMMGDGTVGQDVVKLKKKKLTAAEKEKVT